MGCVDDIYITIIVINFVNHRNRAAILNTVEYKYFSTSY